MSLLIKIITAGLLLLLFVQCQRKKPTKPTLEAWLEANFPGRFQVLATEWDDAIRNLSFKVKKSVVAEASNPMVQVLLRYDLRITDLELRKEDVAASFASAAEKWVDAQSLQSAVKANGHNDWAVGITSGKALFIIFGEPMAEYRRQSPIQLEKVLAQWPAAHKYDKELLLMEANEQEPNKGQILPLSYWLDMNGAYIKQVVFRLFCPYDRSFRADSLTKEWTFNNYSNRLSLCLKESEAAAEKWATQHLKQPYTLLNIIEHEPSAGDQTLLKFKFGFVLKSIPEESTEELTPDGHILAEYDIDRKAVNWVRKE